MNKKYLLSLMVVFLLAGAMRMYFAFRTPYFSDDRAYFVEREVEHITRTGFPFYYDSLSYGGRTQVFLPLFYYSLALFGLFAPMQLALKIVPNLFACSLVFVVYLISFRLTRNPGISLFAAGISTVVPIFVSKTVNSVSPYTLAIPIMFLALYFFMRIGEKSLYTSLLVISFFVLAFTHASVVVLVLGLLIFLVLAKVEGLRTNRAELEVTLFALFFVLWSYFILFKKLFLSYGTAVVWQNIPSELFSDYFREVTIAGVLNQIGIIPLIAGIYILYKYIFRTKNREVYLLAGLAISVSLLLWLKLISFDGGLMILGIILVLFFSQFLKLFLGYFRKTKLADFQVYALVLVGILFIVTSLVLTLFYTDREIRMGFEAGDLEATRWLRNNTNRSDIVLATLREGNLIAAKAERPNVMDSNFLLIPNIDQRLKDLETVFTSSSEIEVVNLLTQYNVRYIYFSKYAKLKYKRTSLPYTEDSNCFQLVYDQDQYQVYRAKCKLEQAA
jgi:hypothetical protein